MRQGGFTLLETIIVMSIIAIIVAVGVPSFRDTIRNNRIITTANDVVTGLTLARTEAIRRNRNVIICGSPDPEAASPACAADGTWSAGWVVYVPAVGSTALDATALVLRGTPVDEPGIEIIRSGGARATFGANGLALLSNSTFSVCDERKTDTDKLNRMRNVVLSNSGRIRVAVPTALGQLRC